ncbi:MAG TPA: hypothetical protein DCY03_17770 [Planctomycetaceae bacterium]|nr:hypothetical protein [Planctomycetaceae bacterium]
MCISIQNKRSFSVYLRGVCLNREYASRHDFETSPAWLMISERIWRFKLFLLFKLSNQLNGVQKRKHRFTSSTETDPDRMMSLKIAELIVQTA